MRIRLWVTVGGESVADRFPRTQTLFVERLFEQLDRDGDGRLSSAEAVHAPSPQIELPESVLAGESENVNVAFNFLAVDTNRDGHATSEELHDFYHYFGDGPIRVTHSSVSSANDRLLHGALWSRLDVNADGLLSPTELAGVAKLMSLDRDGNEVLSASELTALSGDDTNVALAGDEAESFRVRTRSPNASPADLHLILNYPAADSSHGLLPEIVLERHTGRVTGRDDAAGILTWSSNDIRVELQASCGPLRGLDRTRRVLALEFRGADEDEDGIVSSSQRLTEYLEQMFPLLDANGDDSVDRTELEGLMKELLPLESGLRNSQIALSILPFPAAACSPFWMRIMTDVLGSVNFFRHRIGESRLTVTVTAPSTWRSCERRLRS